MDNYSVERGRRREGPKEGRSQTLPETKKTFPAKLQLQDIPPNPTRRTWRGCKNQISYETQTFILKYGRIFTFYVFSSLLVIFAVPKDLCQG